MVLFNQVVQVFRRAQLGIRGQPAIGFQLTHRTMRCRVAVQRDCPRAALLVLIALRKNALAAATSRLRLSLKSTVLPVRSTARYRWRHSPRILTWSRRHERPTAPGKPAPAFPELGA